MNLNQGDTPQTFRPFSSTCFLRQKMPWPFPSFLVVPFCIGGCLSCPHYSLLLEISVSAGSCSSSSSLVTLSSFFVFLFLTSLISFLPAVSSSSFAGPFFLPMFQLTIFPHFFSPHHLSSFLPSCYFSSKLLHHHLFSHLSCQQLCCFLPSHSFSLVFILPIFLPIFHQTNFPTFHFTFFSPSSPSLLPWFLL